MAKIFDAERMLKHMRVLCKDLPPRTPTTEGERKAGEYVSGVLTGLGVKDVSTQTFKGIATMGLPASIAAVLGVLSFPLGWWGGSLGPWLAGAVLLLSAYTIRNLLSTIPPFFQALVAVHDSQNVIAKIPAKGAARKRIFLVGHLDANKQRFNFPTPIPALLKPVETASIVLIALAGLSFWAQALLGWNLFWFQGICLVILLVVLVGLWADEFQPTVEGANDNASAVVVLLDIAHALQSQPLENAEVTLLFTGCEEVGHHGLQAYLDTQRPPVENSYWIDLELVGTGNLCYATKHGVSYFTEYTPGAEILSLAEQTARENPDLQVTGRSMLILEEVATLRRYRHNALCLMGYNEQGYLPNWHRVTDTMEHIEPPMLERTAAFTWQLMQGIDRK